MIRKHITNIADVHPYFDLIFFLYEQQGNIIKPQVDQCYGYYRYVVAQYSRLLMGSPALYVTLNAYY